MQITKLSYSSNRYPDLLREIEKPPKELFLLGELPLGHYVAVVGTRSPSDYGRQVTYKLAYDLASAGIVVVSGLALGLDAAAHKAALDAGGKTVAILGTAINKLYPATNRSLANRILRENGAILSEYPPNFLGHRGSFPDRNRIIAGIAEATLVTEAKAESGSLITAKEALKENRAVFAVPGPITSEFSAGPNNLLRMHKAGAVADVSDILNELNIDNILQKPVKAKSKEEAGLLELLQSGVSSSQDLIEKSGLSAAEFANVISLMEITGKVRNLGAGIWVKR